MDKILAVKDLIVHFHTYEGIVKVLDDVNFELQKGETLGIVGETGCGKSVTVQTILQLIPTPPAMTEKGEILFFVEDVSSENASPAEHHGKFVNLLELTESQMREIRGNRISMVFQEPMTALNPTISVGKQIEKSFLLHRREDLYKESLKRIDQEIKRIRKDLIEYENVNVGNRLVSRFKLKLYERHRDIYKDALSGSENFINKFVARVPLIRGYKTWLEEEVKSKTIELLREVKIPAPEEIIDRYPHELSGGMRQRVLIAMAVACNPDILIADEPTTALDVTTQAEILRLIDKLKSNIGCSVIYITHDLDVISEICDRVAVMYAGVIVEIGSVEAIFEEPMHPYTRGLLRTRLKLGEKREYLDTISGTVPNLIDPPSGCRFHPRCPFAENICNEVKPGVAEVGKGHFVSCHLYGLSQGDKV